MLVNNWSIVLPLPSAKPVAVPEVSAAVQVKVVPVAEPDNVMPVLPPEQILCAAGVAEATGTGLTVITTVIAKPLHPLAEGVMV
jgi:hypothetical protein